MLLKQEGIKIEIIWDVSYYILADFFDNFNFGLFNKRHWLLHVSKLQNVYSLSIQVCLFGLHNSIVRKWTKQERNNPMETSG